jgi:cholesterol 7-desaturase
MLLLLATPLALALAVLLVVAHLAFELYSFFCTPLQLLKSLDDVGGGVRQRKIAAERNGLPSAYPNAWYQILYSHQVSVGQALSVDVLGQRLVVFRGFDNTVYALDAFCPHMGANLGHGGRVVPPNHIECAFHCWQFRGSDGRCVHIPYLDARNASVPHADADAKAWYVLERHGSIYVWYHAQESQRMQPEWWPPHKRHLEPTSSTALFHGRTEHIVAAHILVCVAELIPIGWLVHSFIRSFVHSSVR